MSEETIPEKQEDLQPQESEESPESVETQEVQDSPAAEPEEEFQKKKIRLMTRTEIEKALERARKHMGGNKSFYIRHLLARQAELEENGR